MISAVVDADRLWQSIMDMAEIGATSDGGSCRLALSPEDAAARALLLTWCKPLGLRFEQDAIGNMFLRREGINGQGKTSVFGMLRLSSIWHAAAGAIALGSHLDTVPTAASLGPQTQTAAHLRPSVKIGARQ